MLNPVYLMVIFEEGGVYHQRLIVVRKCTITIDSKSKLYGSSQLKIPKEINISGYVQEDETTELPISKKNLLG